jgi:hypothetical protein
LAAAHAIGKLLDAYGLTMTDVELQSTTCIEDDVVSPFVSNRHPIRYCLGALSTYCNTKYFFAQREVHETWRTVYYFFGLPHDVEVAVYLTHVIMQAFERESRTFKRTADYRCLSRTDKREALKSFRHGMARRLSERLRALKADRDRDLHATGRDLVHVVDAVVSQAFTEAHPHIRTVWYQERPYNEIAYDRGIMAGGSIGLHPGVKNGSSPLQLPG